MKEKLPVGFTGRAALTNPMVTWSGRKVRRFEASGAVGLGARKRCLAVAVLLVAACGGGRARPTTKSPAPIAERTADWLVPLLPEGAQIVLELDLARLRGNAVVGDVATRVLGELGAESTLPGLPISVQGSPLARADALVLGAYGVGTPQAATLIVLVTEADVTNGTRITRDLVALGPPEWVDQLVARAAIAKLAPDAPAPLGAALPVVAAAELTRLREHAMPPKAPGAVLRVTARLPFDARVALARQTGLEAAPAQLSVWADVVDDFAIVIDADAVDPGDRDAKAARKRVASALRGLLGMVAAQPTVRALGIGNNLVNARLIEQGTWVRAIIAVGPRQLARAVERARALLPPAS